MWLRLSRVSRKRSSNSALSGVARDSTLSTGSHAREGRRRFDPRSWLTRIRSTSGLESRAESGVAQSREVQHVKCSGGRAGFGCFALAISRQVHDGRGTHALDALYAGLLTRKVNWVLDADIRGFFEAIDHAWLVKFVEHRIADRRVVRLIQKWLNAGVLEDGVRTWRDEGTPQGGSISPLLANVYLHYVFDLWAQRWRKTQAHGDVIVVRYADDFSVGFQHRADAERFLAELRERFAKFSLELHSEKTRLLEFGPFAAEHRRRAGKGKPETFNFLGFTHISGKKRNGRFTVVRQTIRKRLQAKLSAVKAELRRRLHAPIPEVGRWLRSVVQGHLRYYGVPMNGPALHTFRFQVGRLWYRTLRRRSQTARVTWARMRRLIGRWLPPARITHPYPLRRLGVVT